MAEKAARQGTTRAKPAVRGKALSPNFLAFLIALLLLGGIVALVENNNARAAWALVALLLVGVLLADAGQTLVAAAGIINRLRRSAR